MRVRTTGCRSRPLRKILFAGGKGLVALVAILLSLGALSTPSAANPYFAKQTGRQCQYCHQQGHELAGIHGLNDTGRRFERLFRDDPEKALREFAGNAGNGGGSASHEHGEPCVTRLNCRKDFSQCLFRVFSNGGSRVYRLRRGEHRPDVRVSRDATYCMAEYTVPLERYCPRSRVHSSCD